MKAQQIQSLFIVLAVALSLGGCQKEDVVISSDQQGHAKKQVQIRADFSAPVQTRLTYEPDGAEPYPGLKVGWKVGDAFRLYAVDANNNMLAYEDYKIGLLGLGPDGTTATFTGNAFLEDIVNDAATYKAIFPAGKASNTTVGLAQPYESYFDTITIDASFPTWELSKYHFMHAEKTKAGWDGIDNLSFTAGLDANNWWDVLRFDITLPDGEIPAKAVLYNGAMSIKKQEVVINNGDNPLSLYAAVGNYKVKADTHTSITVFSNTGKVYTYTPNVTATRNYDNNRVYSKVIDFNENLPEITVSDILDDNTVASTGPLSGSGSAEDPYLIQSAADLKYFVSSNRQGSSYKLTANIYVNTSTWNAITLNGVNFDGGSHTISGKLIQTDSKESFGFFGVALSCQISNLYISAAVTANRVNVGAICGSVSGSSPDSYTMKNCINFGDVTHNYIGPRATWTTGGVAGLIIGKHIIENCKNYGTISSYVSSDHFDLAALGGVCGFMYGGVTALGLENYGEVDARKGFANSIAGGIAGVIGIYSDVAPVSLTSCHNHNANIFPSRDGLAGSLVGSGGYDAILSGNTGVTTPELPLYW